MGVDLSAQAILNGAFDATNKRLGMSSLGTSTQGQQPTEYSVQAIFDIIYDAAKKRIRVG